MKYKIEWNTSKDVLCVHCGNAYSLDDVDYTMVHDKYSWLEWDCPDCKKYNETGIPVSEEEV